MYIELMLDDSLVAQILLLYGKLFTLLIDDGRYICMPQTSIK